MRHFIGNNDQSFFSSFFFFAFSLSLKLFLSCFPTTVTNAALAHIGPGAIRRGLNTKRNSKDMDRISTLNLLGGKQDTQMKLSGEGGRNIHTAAQAFANPLPVCHFFIDAEQTQVMVVVRTCGAALLIKPTHALPNNAKVQV